jgi:hypothetical protein
MGAPPTITLILSRKPLSVRALKLILYTFEQPSLNALRGNKDRVKGDERMLGNGNFVQVPT